MKGVSFFASCGQVLFEMGRNVGVMQNAFSFGVLAVVMAEAVTSCIYHVVKMENASG